MDICGQAGHEKVTIVPVAVPFWMHTHVACGQKQSTSKVLPFGQPRQDAEVEHVPPSPPEAVPPPVPLLPEHACGPVPTGDLDEPKQFDKTLQSAEVVAAELLHRMSPWVHHSA
jgi:hypothetical protein